MLDLQSLRELRRGAGKEAREGAGERKKRLPVKAVKKRNTP